MCFPGGGSVPAALYLPRGSVSVSGDGGAGPGGPQSCFPGQNTEENLHNVGLATFLLLLRTSVISVHIDE